MSGRRCWPALLAALFIGCTMSASYHDRIKTMECKDTRDGETFRFSTATLKNIQVGFGGVDTCMNITDSTGRERTLCKSHEAWLKCQEIR